MKKRIGIIAGIAVYVVLSVMTCAGVFDSKTVQEPENIVTEPQGVPDSNRDFTMIENRLEYSAGIQDGMYSETDELKLLPEDRKSILAYYSLPDLVRMSEEDAAEKMSDLQVFKKMEVLNISPEEFNNPEFSWKALYNESLTSVEQNVLQLEKTVEFTGNRASELNTFMSDNQGCIIKVASDHILIDTTINIPSNTILDGNGAGFYAENVIEYAFILENVENICIKNVRLTEGFERGIYIVECNHILLYQNEIMNAEYKPIFVMGTNEYINIVNNSVHDNAKGAVFFEGNISNCIIQHNKIYQNRGTRNLGAGIVLCSVNLDDPYVPYEQEHGKDEYLYEMLDAPHNIIVKDNVISENYSSGIYSDGAYMNYIIDNVVKDNEKEGMCLDFGTFGTYISGNIVERNGDRNRQEDEDLAKDFVLELGRLEDGSSTAKLPGISLDNAAYNIIYNNIVNGNAGSGIKMVRSGYRNVILCNLVSDNNAGKNDLFHGFGIELGHASKPDQIIKGLDFTADYENIIARNVISGHHYSGIYIGTDCYCNDLIDNVIMDCEEFSVENFSELFNSSVGNNTNVGTLNFNIN